jgi:hypothetical protein
MDSGNQENDTDNKKNGRSCSVHAVILDENLYLLLGAGDTSAQVMIMTLFKKQAIWINQDATMLTDLVRACISYLLV